MRIVKNWRQQWQKRFRRIAGGKASIRRQTPEASLNVESLEVRLVPSTAALVQGLNANLIFNGQHLAGPNAQTATTTEVSSNPNPSSEGQSVSFTAVVTGVGATPTGSVDFSDSTTDFGDATLDDSGTAIMQISNLPAGTTTITATYLGDSVNAGSSGTTDQTVQAVTTTTLSSNPNPSVEGQLVTFTAVVTGDAGIPTGLVDFSDGTTDFGTAALDGTGTASMQIGSLPSGTTTITATYLGDSNNTGSFANTDQVVTAATTTSVSGDPNPSTAGQTVTFTAVVSGDAGTPTGLVDFSDSTTDFGTATLDGTGIASIQISTLPAGTTTITATYEGDANNGASDGTTDQTVVGATTTTVSGNPNPSTLNQSVTFTAVVSGAAGTPTGLVDFSDSTTDFGTATLDGSGQATMQISSPPLGTTTVTATYEGDANNADSFGTTDQVVNPVLSATTTSVSGNPNPSTLNQSVTFTAIVSAASGTPTGTVEFTEGATDLGTGTLNGAGQATVQVSNLSLGSNTITATYSGDSNFATSFGTTDQVVNPPVLTATTTTVSGNPNPSALNQTVTFTAAVSSASGTPTGTVDFTEGATNLGTGALNGAGQATIKVSTLALGSNTITATYSGDTNFATSTASTPQTVRSLSAATSTSLSVSPNPATPGQTVTFTATVTSTAGTPTGLVEFSEGTTDFGTATLNSSGQASLQVSTLTLGSHNITATYQANTAFLGSSSTVPLSIANNVESPNTLYVTQLYHDLLQRSPDTQGLAFWVQQLDSGVNRTFVAYDIEQSFERRTLVINAVYEATLLRAPDPTGFNNSMLFLESGDTARQLQALLQASPEYFIVRGHGTQVGFLDSIYLDSLGRLPGASTQAMLLPYLNLGYSHLALATEVATSPEADSRFVSTVYTLFLDRPVDAPSLQGWIDFMVRGGKDDQVVAGILGSDEFFQNSQTM